MSVEYDLPEEKVLEIEDESLESDLSIYEIMKLTAEKNGIDLKEPNPNCKKKDCYGRGYIGIDFTTKQPIPCSCIFPKKQKQKV